MCLAEWLLRAWRTCLGEWLLKGRQMKLFGVDVSYHSISMNLLGKIHNVRYSVNKPVDGSDARAVVAEAGVVGVKADEMLSNEELASAELVA